MTRPTYHRLRIRSVIDETPDTKTIRLDNSARAVTVHRPGQSIKVCVPGPSGPVGAGLPG